MQYPVQTSDMAPYSYWTSWTGGKGDNVSLCLDDDGHLYLLNTNTYLKNLTQGGYPIKDIVYWALWSLVLFDPVRRPDLTRIILRGF